jgi:hypothetical protein
MNALKLYLSLIHTHTHTHTQGGSLDSGDELSYDVRGLENAWVVAVVSGVACMASIVSQVVWKKKGVSSVNV